MGSPATAGWGYLEPMRCVRVFLVALLLVVVPTACQTQAAERASSRVATGQGLSDSAFAQLVARLSEPSGYFDTDNLISNETSYLHVLDRMRALSVSGGAYIGVGPDQNFSYMVQVRPRIALIIDIRRDNLLQHLMFKAIFAASEYRVQYLSMLVGRPAPDHPGEWADRSIEEIVAYVDAAQQTMQLAGDSVIAIVRRSAIELSGDDLETIRRFHMEFMRNGLDLRFSSYGRAPRSYYPTYRQLLLETDRSGRQANFLGSEDGYQYLRAMQDSNLVVPVVGDLAGPHALREIGRVLAERGDSVSAFYVSNVEFYLMRAGTFEPFAENVAALPRAESSVLIRSYFGGGRFRAPHPLAVPGYFSTQLLQTIESFVASWEEGGFFSYWDLVNQNALELN